MRRSGRGASATAAALLGTAAVGLGARRPEAVVVLAAASVVGQSLLRTEDPVFASFLALMTAFYLLARHRTWRVVALGAAVTAAALLLLLLRAPRPFVPVEQVFPLAYFGAATAAGRLVRGRDLHAQALVEAVAREAAARERASLAEERARIARDMHDVVAHSVSLLVVQAESAAAVLPHDPVRAAAQVERVADSGRQALEELRRVLGVLRTWTEAEVGPSPGCPTCVAWPMPCETPVGQYGSRSSPAWETYRRGCSSAPTASCRSPSPTPSVTVALNRSTSPSGGRAISWQWKSSTTAQAVPPLAVVMASPACASACGPTAATDAGPARGGGWRVRATAPLDPA